MNTSCLNYNNKHLTDLEFDAILPPTFQGRVMWGEICTPVSKELLCPEGA